jgi:hypothetical protein
MLPLFLLAAAAATTLPLDQTRLQRTGAEVRWEGDEAVIQFAPSKTPASVTLHPPNESWDLSQAAAVNVELANGGTATADLWIALHSKTADGKTPSNGKSLKIDAGKSGTARLPLASEATRAVRAKLSGMKHLPKELLPNTGAIDLARTVSLSLEMKSVPEGLTLRLRPPRVETGETSADAFSASFFPFVDEYGQYIHRQWPGKLTSPGEFAERAKAEQEELAAHPGPKEWNKWGGWAAGPQLKATGAFRTEKVDGKWWLVDPDGRVFFSIGANVVSPSYRTGLKGRDSWFRDFPGNKAPFNDLPYMVKVDGQPEHYDFWATNAYRKYGPDWLKISPELDARRLRSFGLNTIGNWSGAAYYEVRKTPYTINLDVPDAPRIKAYWEKFVDPYDPAYVDAIVREIEGKRKATATDPWCLGYFVHNELAWGSETSIAQAVFACPPTQAIKVRFVEIMREKYGDIAKLNEAWGSKFESWDALLRKEYWPDQKKAEGDLKTLYTDFCRTYHERTRHALRQAAPDRLYLGCRFAWSTPQAMLAATEFCDVVTWNTYTRSVSGYSLPKQFDKPLMIGEFHFGAQDRGLFGTGLQGVRDQAERAEAYKGYVSSAARNPQIVGVHWFLWRDQPVTGRTGDGENYQVGFVDVTDTPYPELVAASREIGENVYKMRAGK